MKFEFLAKQIYLIRYPTGKIYIGKDEYGSFRYFGSPNVKVVNEDFLKLSKETQMKYTVEKEILWESTTATSTQLAKKEVEFINKYQSNNPEIGYNRWPRWKNDET